MAVDSDQKEAQSQNQNNGHYNLNSLHNVTNRVFHFPVAQFLICKMGAVFLLHWAVMKMKGIVCKMAEDSD